jgi:hypothetical protein
MTSFPIENRACLDAGAFAGLSAILTGHRSFKSALDWALTRKPPLHLEDVLAQDEFSHDSILSGLDGLWLVYDVT